MVNQNNRFYTTGFERQMTEVTESEIKSFMQENKPALDLPTDEFITKIQSSLKEN
jgi:hypothetical protein